MAQLDDSNCSFYLALAESKRFRLGHIRNGKISDRLYPKRKDFVSLNVAIKNLAQPAGLFDIVRHRQKNIGKRKLIFDS